MSETKRIILVVDDEAVVRKILSFNLSRRGYHPVAVDNATSALSELDNMHIDLVLCDINMEGMDGFEFCRTVRRQEKYQALPFIFITAKDTSEFKTRALNIGADDLISKPFDIDQLMLKIEALLKRVEIYRSYGRRDKVEQHLQSGKSRILIVDDDTFICNILQRAFSNEGYEVSVANNVTDALELGRSFSPDIIVSDIMMPEIDGFTFRKMLLEDKKMKDIPFVFLTSTDSEAVMLEGFNYEIKDYILKTTNPKILTAKIGNIITSTLKERRSSILELKEAANKVSIEVVPEKSPTYDGFKIEQWNVPFKDTPGGDFIDYCELDDGRLVVILGDVMGKKWGAWFFAFSFIGYLRSAVRLALDIAKDITAADILSEVNRAIFKDAKISEIFSTISVVLLDKKNRKLQYSGAGDLPMVYAYASSGCVEKIISDGPLLGIFSQSEYSNFDVEMQPGDSVIIMTDGITDSRNPAGSAFGYENLLRVLESCPSENGFDVLKDEFCKYTGNHFDDDVTMIGITALK
jgi:sigma-B regulation protein RsbU (phosphoserine phosphatase)